MNAQAIDGSIRVISDETKYGERHLVVDCADYSAYKALPAGVFFDSDVFSLTGWDSDTCKACYKKGIKFATRLDNLF